MYLVITYGTQSIGYHLKEYGDAALMLAALKGAHGLRYTYNRHAPDVQYARDPTLKVTVDFVDDVAVADPPQPEAEPPVATEPLDSL